MFLQCKILLMKLWLFSVHCPRGGEILTSLSFRAFCSSNHCSLIILRFYSSTKNLINLMFSYPPPTRFLLLADTGVMLAVRELTRHSSASGQEGSRMEKHGRKKYFLSVWWCRLRGRREPKVAREKRKKAQGGKGREGKTLNKNFIKFSVLFL